MHIITENWWAAGAHTLAFSVLLGYYLNVKNSKSYASTDVFRDTLANPPVGNVQNQCSTEAGASNPGKCNVKLAFQQPKKIGNFNAIFGALAFFAITAFAHVYYATDAFGSGKYTAAINEGWNPYRWIEYAISASLMSVLIGGALGIRQVSTLALLAGSTAALNLQGRIVEGMLKNSLELNKDGIYTSTASGWILFAVLWGVLLYGFGAVYNDVNEKFKGLTDPSDNNKPIKIPSFVWFIILTQLLNYALFGFIQLGHIYKRFHSDAAIDYTVIEKQYLKLSFAGKLALAGGLGYGLLFRVKDCA